MDFSFSIRWFLVGEQFNHPFLLLVTCETITSISVRALGSKYCHCRKFVSIKHVTGHLQSGFWFKKFYLVAENGFKLLAIAGTNSKKAIRCTA